jgi:hypothetical protein
MIRVTLDIADLTIAQGHAYAATAGTHIAGGIPDFYLAIFVDSL